MQINNRYIKCVISFRYIDVLIIELNGMKANLDFNYYPKNLGLKLSSNHNDKKINNLDVNLKK